MRAPARPRRIRTCSLLHTYSTQLPRQTHSQHSLCRKSAQTHENTAVDTHPTCKRPARVHMDRRMFSCMGTRYNNICRHTPHVTFSNVPPYISILQHTHPVQAHPTLLPGTRTALHTQSLAFSSDISFGDLISQRAGNLSFFTFPTGPHPEPPLHLFIHSFKTYQYVLECVHLDLEHTNLDEL